jgi:hypothetical protein
MARLVKNRADLAGLDEQSRILKKASQELRYRLKRS